MMKNDPALKASFINAASDLAFLQLFFLETPGPAADIIEGLRRVLPPESPLLARLEGWSYLIRKQNVEARQRLSAVEGSDALASLGLLRLEPDTAEGREAAATRARGLRSTYSHGVTGAILFSDLAPRRTPLVLSSQAEQVRQVLGAFPKQLLRLIDSPQSFYFVRVEPLSSSVPYGRPVLVKVSLVNGSEVDLSMGPSGAIRNDLFFNVQVRGMRPQAFPATVTALSTLTGAQAITTATTNFAFHLHVYANASAAGTLAIQGASDAAVTNGLVIGVGSACVPSAQPGAPSRPAGRPTASICASITCSMRRTRRASARVVRTAPRSPASVRTRPTS
jgi:hypothetical protein